MDTSGMGREKEGDDEKRESPWLTRATKWRAFSLWCGVREWRDTSRRAVTVRDPVCRATSSPANIPSGRPRKPPPKVANMLIKETSLRYRDTSTTPSRLRIDPFPLSLSLSLSPCVSRFRRLVRNPEIAHAHRRATSSTISDGTSSCVSRAFLGGRGGGWISIDRRDRNVFHLELVLRPGL